MKNIRDIILLALIAFVASCTESKLSENYDIEWPIPTITSISSSDVTVGDAITIQGTELSQVTNLWIGDQSCIIDTETQTDASITFTVPRRASSGVIRLKNVYRREVATETSILVNYPEVKVTTWPSSIEPGTPFTLKGENVDLITEVVIGGVSVKVTQPASTDQTVIPTATFNLVVGAFVDIKVTALGYISESEISGVEVKEPGESYVPTEAIILWDFENEEPTTEAADVAADEYGINLDNLPKGRGNNYYSVKKAQTGGWTNFMFIVYDEQIDLGLFHEPHISFLVNTNGKRGYVNPFFTQDGSTKDNHLTDGNAGDELKYGDNYSVQTEGWEWRSYPISKLFGDFNPTGIFEGVKMRFTSGNVGNGDGPEDFEIHIDQIMITDGPINPGLKVFDFEAEAPTWEENISGANYSLNGTAVTSVSGNNYYSVDFVSPGSWKWMGAISNSSGFNIGDMKDPHISFLANTGDNSGFMQIEIFQKETKWGATISSDYMIKTDGWQMVSLRLSDIMTSNWGGDATEFDPKSSMDYVRLGFSTGNIESGTFEMNVDDVYISDGPMW